MGLSQSILSEQDRAKLDGIVRQMEANNEPEENIRFVVDDFKSKYSVKKKEPSPVSSVESAPSLPKDGSLPTTKTEPNTGALPSATPSSSAGLTLNSDSQKQLSEQRGEVGRLDFSEPKPVTDYTNNPIGGILKTTELANRKKVITTADTGGGAVSFAPDEEAVKESKTYRDQLNKQGFTDKDIQDISDEMKDIPVRALQSTERQQKLLKLRKENPQAYSRQLSADKWELNLEDALFDKKDKGEISPEELQSVLYSVRSGLAQRNDMSYIQKRKFNRDVSAYLDKYIPNEGLRDRLKASLAADRSFTYGTVPDKVFETDERSKIFSPTQVRALQFLEDTNPEAARSYYNLQIDPKKLEGNELAKQGWEEKSKRLEELGLTLQQNAAQERLNTYLKKENLSPEEAQVAQQLQQQVQELEKQKTGLAVKYPSVIKHDADEFAQELLGQQLGASSVFAKAGQEVGNTAQGIGELFTEPFRSEEGSKINQLSILGQTRGDELGTYRTKGNRVFQDYDLKITDKLHQLIDPILNQKGPWEEKYKQLYPILLANPTEWGKIPKKANLNLSPSSLFYSVGDMAATLAPFVAAETLTGGGATAGAGRKMLSTFTSALGTSFHDSYASAVKEGKTDPYAHALTTTAVNAAAMAGAGTPEAIRGMFSTKTAVGELVSKLTNDEIKSLLNNKSVQALKDFGKTIGRNILEGAKGGAKFEAAMLPAKIVNAGINGEQVDGEQLAKEALVGVLNFSLLGGLTSVTKLGEINSLRKDALVKAGQQPEVFKEAAAEGLKNGSISKDDYRQIVSNIDQSAELQKKVPFVDNKGKDLDPNERGELLALKIQEKRLKEAKAKDLPEVLKEKVEQKLEEIRIETENVYRGKKKEPASPVSEPVRETETKTNEGTETATQESVTGTGQAGTDGTTPVLESEKEGGETKGEEDLSQLSDAKIGKRMTEIDNGNYAFTSPKWKEFNRLEKEQDRRDRESVFSVPLDKVHDALNALQKKDKEMPHGWGVNIDKEEINATKRVATKYLDPESISDSQVRTDFKEAVLGNPDTYYADGLKLRESAKLAAERGIQMDELLQNVEEEFIRDGYSPSEAKEVIAGKLKPIFEGAQKVETDNSKLIGEGTDGTTTVLEQPKIETNEQQLPTGKNVGDNSGDLAGSEQATSKPEAGNASGLSAEKEGFTDGKDLNRIYAAVKAKYGEKKGAQYYEAANRLVNPNKNTIVEIRSNGVVVKEGGKYILKPFGNTDAHYKKWTLYKGIDISAQFPKPNQGTTPERSVATEAQPEKPQPTTKEDFGHFREAMLSELENRSTDPLELKVKHPELPVEQKTILQGIKNIREGKQTKASQAVESAIQKTYDEGTVHYEQGAGNQKATRGVPVHEMIAYQKALSEATPEQRTAAQLAVETEPLPHDEMLKWMEEEAGRNYEDENFSNLDTHEEIPSGHRGQDSQRPNPQSGLPENSQAGEGSGTRTLSPELNDTAVAEAGGQNRIGQPEGQRQNAEGSPEVTSIKNAVTKSEREARGQQEIIIEQSAKRSFGQAFDRGKEMVENNTIDPRTFAQQLVDKPRPLSAEESAALLYDRMRLYNEHRDVLDAYNKAEESNNDEVRVQMKVRLAYLENAINLNDEAARKAGYEQGLGLAARRMMLKQDYSLQAQLQVMRAAKGEALTDAERLHIEELETKLKDALDKLEEYEKRKADEEVEQLAKETHKAVRSQKRKTSVDEIKKEREQIKAELKDKWKKFSRGQLNAGVPLPVELIPDLVKLARNYVSEGVIKAEELIDKVHADVSEFMEGVSKRDIRDAISGYGKVRQLSKEEIDVQMRDLNAQLRELSKLEDLESGQHPKRSGMQRDKPSDDLRELQRKVYQKAKEAGISFTGKTPEEAQRTALDTIKTRLRNQIADLTRQIETGEKSPEKTSIPYDEEANSLKAERDKLKAELEDIEGKPELSTEQRIEIARKAVERSIADYERRIKEKDFEREQKKTPETPELKSLKEKRDALKDEWENLKPDTIRLAAALKAYKTRLQTRKAELEQKVATNDFSKKPQRKITPDMEALNLQKEVQKAKDAFEKQKYKFEMANRTPAQKTMDWIVRWRREALLTGIPTLGKLAIAASSRIGFSPIEEMYGGLISKVPGISTIAEKAPREGGLSIKAEAASISQVFSLDTLNQMLEIVKTGKSREDRLFGNKVDLPNEAFEFFGRVHGALKYPAKKAEIYRAFEKRVEHAAAKGFDVSDPTVQATLWSDAYMDGNRAIFMNENLANKTYKSMLGYLRNQGTGGKVAAAIGQILLPIVKVPVNFVLETTHYAFGLPKAAFAVGNAMVKGMENMTPQEADYIMRMLKKGSIGLALFSIGFLNPQAIGGYYTGKRRDDDLNPNDLLFFGMHIPHWAQHVPPIEVMQLGATVRRVKDSYEKKNINQSGAAEGIFQGTVGLLSETPFIDQPKRLLKASSSIDNASKYGADLASSMVIPMGIKNVADWTDTEKDSKGKDVKRSPQTFGDYFKMGIPGLREQVPTKEEAKKKKGLGGLGGGLLPR